MQFRGFRRVLVSIVVVAIGVVLAMPWSAPRAHGARLQDERGLDLKFPFQPGEEWKITNGTSNHTADREHNAIDFAPVNGLCEGKPVIAADHGWVHNISTGVDGVNRIIIRHVNNWYTLYSHLATPSPLHKGDEVFHGTQIGTCGHSGKTWPDAVPPLRLRALDRADHAIIAITKTCHRILLGVLGGVPCTRCAAEAY